MKKVDKDKKEGKCEGYVFDLKKHKEGIAWVMCPKCGRYIKEAETVEECKIVFVYYRH